MKYILIFSIILISCSKQPIEQNNIPLPKGVDTLPSFVVHSPVKVYVQNDVGEAVKWAVNEAVNNWSKILPFEIVDNQMMATTIVSVGDFNDAWAWGFHPANEYTPGKQILISKYSPLNRFQLANAVMHELGHNLGFHHIYSNVSVMNIDCYKREWNGWGQFDLSLIKTYYK
jgi:predicted Zn-dependent protease